MSFDDFSDLVEAHLMQEQEWTESQVADFISPRTRRLIQAYQDGDSSEKPEKNYGADISTLIRMIERGEL